VNTFDRKLDLPVVVTVSKEAFIKLFLKQKYLLEEKKHLFLEKNKN